MALRQISSAAEMQAAVMELRRKGNTIACVPTMGYLHDGHASLMRHAKTSADVVVATIFVNPKQFGPNEDFTRYPRDLERDLGIAEAAGVDIVFTPSPADMYPPGYSTSVSISGITDTFEGALRPGHFDGVATVVAKLLLITMPDVAVFGQKDWQQTLVIRRLVADLNIFTEVVVVPTRREPDGLAMSSRNVYLSPEQRALATSLWKALQAGEQAIAGGECRRAAIELAMQEVIRSNIPDAVVDYASAAEADTLHQPEEFAVGHTVVLLLAVRVGATRLIDNALVQIPQ